MRSKRPIRFRRTDQLERLVRVMTQAYYNDRGIELSKAQLRRKKNMMLVAIEEGTRDIRLNKVAVRTDLR